MPVSTPSAMTRPRHLAADPPTVAEPGVSPAAACGRGFTLIEVMIAVMLVGIVGTAVLAFLTALARGGEARGQLSDPAVESVLASRRIDTLIPGFRAVLLASGDSALIWTTDRIASRSVHLSETALVRFDPDEQELVLETPRSAAFFDDRALEREFLTGQYASVLGTFDTLRESGRLEREILAEGLDSIQLSTVLGSPGVADVLLANEFASAGFRLAPVALEEPLR